MRFLRFDARSWLQPILLLGLINSGIWIITIVLIQTAPKSYTTALSINVPSSNSNTSLNLSNLGTASVQQASPYGNSLDPRASYKMIAESESVITQAAELINVPAEGFGKPKIALPTESTIMNIELQGKTPEEVVNKINALYQAIEVRLTQLRAEEIDKKEKASQVSLDRLTTKLRLAENNVNQYRLRSGLSSDEQIKDLARNIEELRRIKTELSGQLNKSTARLQELNQNLAITPAEASDSFTLQSDPLFQQHLKNYSEVAANVVLLESLLKDDNPELKLEKEKRDRVLSALNDRRNSLVGNSMKSAEADRRVLGSTPSGGSRDTLFRDLVTTQVDQKGIQTQVATLDQQMIGLEDRLQKLVQRQSSLDVLRRDVQISEAVLTSKLTQLDVNRGNLYESYPLIQKLAEPDRPKKQKFSNTVILLVTSTISSVLLSSGILVFYYRKYRKSQPVTPHEELLHQT